LLNVSAGTELKDCPTVKLVVAVLEPCIITLAVNVPVPYDDNSVNANELLIIVFVVNILATNVPAEL
jgi:hypothetical protein